MTSRKYALVAGAVLIGLGLVLGLFVSVSVTGTQGIQSCGSPWVHTPSSNPDVQQRFGAKNQTDYAAECSAARQSRGLIAALLVVGGAVVGGLYFVQPAKSRSS